MRRIGVGLLVGLLWAAAIALVGWLGARTIGAEVLRAIWILPATIGLHAVQLRFAAVAWRRATGGGPPRTLVWLCIRWIRESVNSLLPVAQIGGNVVGARLLAQRGVPLPLAVAGTTLDLTLEAATQAAFTFAGIAALAVAGPDGAWRPWLGGGLLLGVLGIGGFVVAQRAGLLRLMEAAARLFARLIPALPADSLGGLHAALQHLQRDRRAIAVSTALHLLAWGLGTFETLLALAAMGQTPGLLAALVLESLGMAARSAGFAIPGAAGVQEAGFVLAGAAFGLPADLCIALSMVKRARELCVGLGGLLAWQIAETRRFA